APLDVVVGEDGAFIAVAARAQHFDLADEGADAAAVPDAGVGLQRAADGAGDADGELEAAEAPGGGLVGQPGEHDGGAGADGRAVEAGAAAGGAQREHDCGDAAVGNEDVRAAADDADGQADLPCPLEDALERVEVPGRAEVGGG